MIGRSRIPGKTHIQASYVTGPITRRHRVLDNRTRLDPTIPTFAAELRLELSKLKEAYGVRELPLWARY